MSYIYLKQVKNNDKEHSKLLPRFKVLEVEVCLRSTYVINIYTLHLYNVFVLTLFFLLLCLGENAQSDLQRHLSHQEISS